MSEVSPLLVLRARAEARALLYRTGEFDFGEATEPLLVYAFEAGLVAMLGSEAVETIILDPFQVGDA